MYKVAKKTSVDLNTTKIYLLKYTKNTYYLSINLIFSINFNNYHYRDFVRESLEFVKPNYWLFDIEDYETYLADTCEYKVSDLKEKYQWISTPLEGTKWTTMYWFPNPHNNLLENNIDGLIEYKNTTLSLLPSGLFKCTKTVDNTNTTRAVIKDLKRIQQGKTVSKCNSIETKLLQAIKTLDINYN